MTFAKLEDWTKRSEEGIRNYSGVAVYRKTFELPAASQSLELDLGDVQSIARVRVNGHEVGTLWKSPYRIDIAAAVRPGKNSLEIEVVNTWLNRLLGDDQPGAAKRSTSATTKTWNGPPLAVRPAGPGDNSIRRDDRLARGSRVGRQRRKGHKVSIVVGWHALRNEGRGVGRLPRPSFLRACHPTQLLTFQRRIGSRRVTDSPSLAG